MLTTPYTPSREDSQAVETDEFTSQRPTTVLFVLTLVTLVAGAILDSTLLLVLSGLFVVLALVSFTRQTKALLDAHEAAVDDDR